MISFSSVFERYGSLLYVAVGAVGLAVGKRARLIPVLNDLESWLKQSKSRRVLTLLTSIMLHIVLSVAAVSTLGPVGIVAAFLIFFLFCTFIRATSITTIGDD